MRDAAGNTDDRSGHGRHTVPHSPGRQFPCLDELPWTSGRRDKILPAPGMTMPTVRHPRLGIDGRNRDMEMSSKTCKEQVLGGRWARPLLLLLLPDCSCKALDR